MRSRPHMSVCESSGPSNRIKTPCTARNIRSASPYFPSPHRDWPRLYAADCRAAFSSTASRTRAHHASASPVRIAPVNLCLHVWHSHHSMTPRCPACETAACTMHSMCTKPASSRHAQPDWIGGGCDSQQM
jgi:hypothetical protein